MPFLTPDPTDFDEVCRVLVIPAGYAAVVMGALHELTKPYNWQAVGDTVDDAVALMEAMISAAYESDCNMAGSPREHAWLWNEGKVNAGNALQLNVLSTSILNGYWQQNTAAINDEMLFTAMLEEGTYDLTIIYRKGGFGGIAHFIIDGAEDAQTVDTYAGGASQNNESTISVVVVGSGLHEIKVKMSSKNASSGGYFMQATMMKMIRTGD